MSDTDIGGAELPETGRPTVDRHMLDALVCPVTQGQLSYDAAAKELISRTAHLAFPIRNGIPIMLASEARELD
jgi:uncharacterized protein YbaR (Trm112 family)